MQILKPLFALAQMIGLVQSYNYTYVPEVDLSQYDGLWYQVYGDLIDETFEGVDCKCVTAMYEQLDGGNISVMNREISRDGTVQEIYGTAFYLDENTGGELSVVFDDVPSVPVGSYWIIELGPVVDDQYDYAIVSDNKQAGLFVLTRDVETFFEEYDDDVQDTLELMGFTKLYNKPILTNQDECF